MEPNGTTSMRSVTDFVNWPGPSQDYPIRPPLLKGVRFIVAPTGTDCFTDGASTGHAALTAVIIAVVMMIWPSLA